MSLRLSPACSSRRSGNDNARAAPSARSVRPSLLCLLVFGTALGAVVGAPIKVDRTVYRAAPMDPPPERR